MEERKKREMKKTKKKSLHGKKIVFHIDNTRNIFIWNNELQILTIDPLLAPMKPKQTEDFPDKKQSQTRRQQSSSKWLAYPQKY